MTGKGEGFSRKPMVGRVMEHKRVGTQASGNVRLEDECRRSSLTRVPGSMEWIKLLDKREVNRL